MGKKVRHKKLGIGRICQILDKNMIIVQFNNGEKRKIDSQYCINNAIIMWEDEEDET